MKRKILVLAAMFALIVVSLGIWWSWAQFSEDAISPTNFARINDGMTLEDVRAVLGQESHTDIYQGDAMYFRWEGRNKVITVRCLIGSTTIVGKEIIDENCMARQLRTAGELLTNEYQRFTSSNSGARPVNTVIE